jgi:DNA-binding NarL/FixJ family response regulator
MARMTTDLLLLLEHDMHPIPVTPDDLTARQREVVQLVARGFTDKRIAGELGMEYNTVRVHVAAIAFRLHLTGAYHTRVGIARWWYESIRSAA